MLGASFTAGELGRLRLWRHSMSTDGSGGPSGRRSRSAADEPRPGRGSSSRATPHERSPTTCVSSGTVPKGLPTEGGSRRRAVHKEAPPLESLEFEGEIPAGEYGGGTIDVYDTGPYEVLRERERGGLTFRLEGERLRGVWTLVPARLEGEERNWLLLKREEGARVARPERYLLMLATLVDEVPSR